MPGTSQTRFWILAIGVVAASLDGVAILLHAWAGVHMAFTVIVMAPLSVVILLALAAWSRKQGEEIFIQRLAGGLFAGFMGLVAYDVVRWIILISGMVPFNPFRAIEVFGLLILKTDAATWLTKSVGWAFHIWNGLSFAVMFTLAFGCGTVLLALAWSLVLEVAMLASYPSMFRIKLEWPFISVSLAGHIAYGLALGYAARGAVKA